MPQAAGTAATGVATSPIARGITYGIRRPKASGVTIRRYPYFGAVLKNSRNISANSTKVIANASREREYMCTRIRSAPKTAVIFNGRNEHISASTRAIPGFVSLGIKPTLALITRNVISARANFSTGKI